MRFQDVKKKGKWICCVFILASFPMSVRANGLLGLIEPGVSSPRGQISQPAWASGFGLYPWLCWGGGVPGLLCTVPCSLLCAHGAWFVFCLSREEEDIAVSMTPEKPLRRGLSNRSDPNAVAPAPQGVRLSLGPLSPEKLEEILHEANRLAAQLEQCALQEQESPGDVLGPRKESPTCNLFPASKSPASSPLARSTPPIRGKAGPSGRATASPPTPVRPVLAPQPSTSNSQRLSRPQGAAAKPSSRLPVPSAIPRPASRMPLTSRSVPPSKGALPPASLPTRKGLPRPSAAGHRVPISQRPNLPAPGATRSNLQPPKKVAVPGPTR
ncbi:proline/serine-rich coiled-coil protein 1 isoform X4 [Mirounga leonina]|uniref:proline/serine-rich coiled-coil protein 1 isoform X4 n=1 Tax=Mirounga leonina TaxID=9715 RepID=UPI00156BF112|nr:proline/serine-rich coiled-coil protein 1 isoform X4 [Mirounga leonina]